MHYKKLKQEGGLYRVDVKSTIIETYHLYAKNADEAMERWSDGKFIETGDRIDAEPISAIAIPEGKINEPTH